MDGIIEVPLHDATRERYLNYALSVITSRALPDVRDGLKPVQRRILYTMFHELTLHPGGRYKKCASVVGDVMGKYHPHGDQSIYDALVRMAQDFSLRETLVDGQGNFGSLDGDPPAAMRYTECKLTRIAEELLQELKQDTVEVRDTYDGERTEPVVLPAQFPQLLVNGVEGIAVGLSTRIPPHNLGEIIDACVALIDGEASSNADLLKHVQGPDFPTGGRLLADHAALLDLYETGQGSLKLRGTWREERDGRTRQVIIDAIPYGQNKSKLVERIGGDVAAKKLPQVVDVRDESTDEVRIVLDLKQGANAEAVMAYLFKRTPLEATVSVFMNALVPTDRPDLATPERLDLMGCLQHWLDFRYETIRRRFVYELRKLEERIHILEGFAILFGDLDEAIRLIRASDGRQDAKHKLMEAFPLDEIQTDAILDLRLYKLARLEIASILDELEEKRAEAAEIRAILGSEARMWHRVRTEVLEIRNLYASPRRTVVGDAVTTFTFDESAYVVKEETFLVVTRGGWVKRQSSFTEVDRIRVKDTDVLGWLIRTDTAASATFFGSDGSAYTLRVDAVPQTAGYGKPLQSFFSMDDGATISGVVVHDAATWVDVAEGPPPEGDDPPPPHVVSVTRQGRIQRFALAAHAEPSNKNGRIFARLSSGDEVVAAYPSQGGEHVCLASREGNVLTFPATEAKLLKAAGKGTTGIKLKAGDEVLAFELSTDLRSGPQVSTTNGRTFEVTPSRFAGSRAARGKAVIKRGGLQDWARLPFVYTGETSSGGQGSDGDDHGSEGGEA